MIETDRLIIDRIKKEDKEDYFYNISHDKKVLKTFICRYEETLEGFDFESIYTKDSLFAIRLKDNKKLIGLISLYKDEGNEIEIGYGIGSSYWNKGYVTEAVKPFIKYLFNTRDVNVIQASYFKGNDASKRVMEKCGMKYSHITHDELAHLGDHRDLIYYKIDRNEYISTCNK